MNEAYEVELTNLEASFINSPFNLIIGVERQSTLVVDGDNKIQGFTDVEWQVIYSRVFTEGRWMLLSQATYDEIDELYGDMIGDQLWLLSQSLN